MTIRVVPIDHPDALWQAVETLQRGELVVLPTDTVYGVAADPWNERAVAALYAAKGRPPDKAVPILLSDTSQALRVASHMPEVAQVLSRAFWPGPLTLVVPKHPDVPATVSALPTIGLRVPDHNGARTIIEAAGGALAVTSANRSDQPPALTAQKALVALGASVSYVLDGGRCSGAQASTVVDVSEDDLRLLRPGPLSEDALRAVLERAAR